METGWESKLNLGFFVQVILHMMVLLTEIKPQEEKQLCRGFNSNLEDICVFPEHHTIPRKPYHSCRQWSLGFTAGSRLGQKPSEEEDTEKGKLYEQDRQREER